MPEGSDERERRGEPTHREHTSAAPQSPLLGVRKERRGEEGTMPEVNLPQAHANSDDELLLLLEQ
jgi:hypothetical protein